MTITPIYLYLVESATDKNRHFFPLLIFSYSKFFSGKIMDFMVITEQLAMVVSLDAFHLFYLSK